MKLPSIVNQIKIMTKSQSGEASFCTDEPTNMFIWPIRDLPPPNKPKVVTSCFGSRDTSTCETVCSSTHQGLDISTGGQPGADVLAAADGRVKSVGGSYNTVVIDHGNGYETYYLHNNNIIAKSGATVTRGDIIAESGGYGPKGPDTYPYHLHFGVKKNGDFVDPLCFFDRKTLRLAYAQSSNCYYNSELYSYGGEAKKNVYYA